MLRRPPRPVAPALGVRLSKSPRDCPIFGRTLSSSTAAARSRWSNTLASCLSSRRKNRSRGVLVGTLVFGHDNTPWYSSTSTHVVAQRDHRGKTPLHCACAKFVPWQIVQLLLDAHPAAAKVRTRDHGQTPLHLACEYNAPRQTIHLLVDAYPEAVKYLRVVDKDNNTSEARRRKQKFSTRP